MSRICWLSAVCVALTVQDHLSAQLIAFVPVAVQTQQATTTDSPAEGNGSSAQGSRTSPEGDANTEQAAEAPEYVRIRRNERNLAVALETSVVQMDSSEKYPGAKVDLIGAIHLGESGYYQELNTLFGEYDVLLFEAVMPEEAVRRDLRPGGGGGGSARPSLSDEQEWTEAKIGLAAISILQLGMKDALGLEFQLSGINYSRENFVHADMTSEEFEQSMLRRGESFSQMLGREMAKAMTAQQEQNPLAMNLDLMLSALSSDRVFRVRRIAAVQLAKAGDGQAFSAADGTSTIITERNIKALQVLERELKKGHQRIGIFYGAGHLLDMEKRMVEEFGFQRAGESWLTAWNLRSNPQPKKPVKTESHNP